MFLVAIKAEQRKNIHMRIRIFVLSINLQVLIAAES